MSIDLPRDLENRIRAQISSGQFDSEQDVVREALDTLEKRQRGLVIEKTPVPWYRPVESARAHSRGLDGMA